MTITITIGGVVAAAGFSAKKRRVAMGALKGEGWCERGKWRGCDYDYDDDYDYD